MPVRGEKGEMNELVGLFNQMLDKNNTLIEAMHNSLDNVAHDLRTPMTRLRGIAELALQSPEKEEACQEALADCMEESERVLTMLNALMDVAEAETGTMRLNRENVSVPDAIRSVVDLYEIVAEEKQIAIDLDLPESLVIQADQTRLQQVLANLLDNAIKYSSDGKQVSISARQRRKRGHDYRFRPGHGDRPRRNRKDMGPPLPGRQESIKEGSGVRLEPGEGHC